MRGNGLKVLAGVLRDQRTSIMGWTAGASIVALFYLAFYPMIGGDQMDKMLELLPQGMADAFGMANIANATGYANATIYTLLGMVIILIFAVTTGARLIGGEEEHGVLELEYTAPVSRAQSYLGRLATIWLQLLVPVLGVSVVVTAVNAIASLGIIYANIWLTGVGLWVFTGTFGTIALAYGAATGRRSMGLGVSVSLAVIAYLLNAVGGMAKVSWMQAISPVHWYSGNEPLLHGLDWGGIGLLAILAVLPGLYGWAMMRRRDLMVG